MLLVDTHTHLIDPVFDKDREQVLERAFSAGILQLIEVATNPDEWEKTLAFCRTNVGKVVCSWGFHPHYSHEWRDSLTSHLKDRMLSPLIVGVGELGLDYVKSSAPPHIQQRTMRKMVEAAAEIGKPIILHCREAYDDLFSILGKYWKPDMPGKRFKGVLHCFSGDREQARRALGLGLAVGVNGPVTYPKNDALREAVIHSTLDNLVLETDCPYLSPQESRGSRNEPSSVVSICRKLAEVFGVSAETVAEKTTRNAKELFGI